MFGYRAYGDPSPLLIGYDPVRDLPADHLARLIEHVVGQVQVPAKLGGGPGQPEYHPHLCLKVLLYGYSTGVRSSRQLSQACRESLPYLFLTRGDAPSHTLLNTFRKERWDLVEEAWVTLFAVAEEMGLKRVGRIVVDTMKLRANASRESVVEADEYGIVLQVLREVLKEAEEVDAREDQEGFPGATQVGKPVEKVQMREILRRARKRLGMEKRAAAAKKSEQPASESDTATGAEGQTATMGGPAVAGGNVVAGEGQPPVPTAPGDGMAEGVSGAAEGEGSSVAGDSTEATKSAATSMAAQASRTQDDTLQQRWLSEQMRGRVEEAVRLLEEAMNGGRKFISLTDPDAEMMSGGVDKQVRERHSFEVSVDEGARLLVAGGATQEPTDNARLLPLIAAAGKHEPGGVKAATGDSGFFNAGVIGELTRKGVDLCIPDSNTAGDLHRGLPIGTTRAKSLGGGEFTYNAEKNEFVCSEGNTLEFHGRRTESGRQITEYRAANPCVECRLVGICMVRANGKHRTIRVDEYEKELTANREQFSDPAHKERYDHRGEQVEGVFGFLIGVLGYTRWLLRRKEGVAAEGSLFKAAYQIRKVYRPWAARVAAA